MQVFWARIIFADVQIVLQLTMTVRQPTMTAAASIEPKLKAATPSAAVRIVQLLTITWMLRLMTAAVLFAVWIPVFHVF